MKHLKRGLFILMAVLSLFIAGCKADVVPESGSGATLNLVVKGLSYRTVFPDVKAENLKDIVFTYSKAGSEEKTVKNWNSFSEVGPVSIEVGTYNFTLSAKYNGFEYSGSVENKAILSGDNTVEFDLKLSGMNAEDMEGKGTIEHTLTYPDDGAVDHVTVALYEYDEDDELVLVVAEETVTVTDNGDGTFKAAYTKEVDSGEYVMKYFFYADEEETLCLDEYSVVVYVLKDIKSKADEETERICSVYSVVYEMNGGTWAEGYNAPVQFTYLDGLTLPAAGDITRPGYDFVKWSTANSSSGEAVTEYNEQKDIKVYAIWSARTDTVYTVKYWKQNIADDGYAEDEDLEETGSGTTDTETEVSAPELTGFTAKAFEQVNIDGDGSAVLNLYYDRNIYYITFVLGSATTETELDEQGRISGRYEAPVQMSAPSLSGYLFKSWLNEVNAEESLPLIFTSDRTFVANFESLGAEDGGTSLSLNIINEDVKIIETTSSRNSITLKADEGYTSYSWKLNGVKQDSTTNTLNFIAGSSFDYRISLTAKKNGIRYSTNVILNYVDAVITPMVNMVSVITESTTIVGDQTEGVFLNGRTVTLSPYSIGKYEVTQALYETIMGTNPSNFRSEPAEGEIQELRPVDEINWYRAIAFCNKLSLRAGYDVCYSVKDDYGNEIDWENLAHDEIPTDGNSNWDAAVCDMTKNGYRLPTEAEWEFAARGGDQSEDDWNNTYSGSNEISDVVWYADNSDDKTHEVGKKAPNRLGLYDITGNLWERCNDWYGDISTSGTVIDPIGTSSTSSSQRAVRGGGYDSGDDATVYLRGHDDPCYHMSNNGIRLARSAVNWKEEHDRAVELLNQKRIEIINSRTELVDVITESTTVTGDQSEGVFLNGRTVTLSPYSIGKYEVTQELYEAVMETNPSCYNSNPEDGEKQEIRPVENINWYRAIAFCNKLSLKKGYDVCYSIKDDEGNEIDWENLAHSDIPTDDYDSNWDAAVCDMTKNGYRLPTEAEWEFAARGGDQSEDDWNYTYSGSDIENDVVWYEFNSNNITHEVGKKIANRLGLYDMSGNVWEWCNDWFGDISTSETVTNPTGSASGSDRVRRGGCCVDNDICAVSYRRYDCPYFHDFGLGFRLARSADNWKEEHDKAVAAAKATMLSKSKEMVPVITESTTIVGDQSDGVFLEGRTVTLSPYSIGKYQVTQVFYEDVMGVNPSSYNSDPADGETQEFRPVEFINWYRAIAFCNKLSLREGYDLCYSVKDSSGNEIDWENLSLSDIPTDDYDSNWDAAVCDMTKNGYRLPTEAEWEFAARGGDQSAADWNYTYSGSNTLGDVAWYEDNSDDKTHEVGKKTANRLGIYDMSGNVWEWCNDWFDDISTSETVTDPAGPTSGSNRVHRGGSCSYSGSDCAVSLRGTYGPWYGSSNYGFRLTRSGSN